MSRRPKGSYVRHTTDWFLNRSAIGAVFVNAGNGNSLVVELYNNASDGSNLHVYRIWVGNDAAGAYWITRQTGTQGGTQVPTYPIISSGAVPFGIVNFAFGPIVDWEVSPGPFIMPAYIASSNEAGSQDTWGAPGPICVLVPGDSLQVFLPTPFSTSRGIGGVTYYWTVLRDLG